ncbi:hypothetical protein THRCLA_22029, partial [Thraustotheca clavata]
SSDDIGRVDYLCLVENGNCMSVDVLLLWKYTSDSSLRISESLSELCHCIYQFLHGNKFHKVTAEMFYGYVRDDLGSWVDTPLPLYQLQEISKLDLNPMPIVSEFAFNAAPTLKLIYLPFFTKIQYQALSEMRLDRETFDGFQRLPIHPLEDPAFMAFSRY